MKRRHTLREQSAFFLLFAVITALTIWLIYAYLDIVALSCTAVIILKPLYDQLAHGLRGRVGLALTLTILVVFVALVVPLLAALAVIASQVTSLAAYLQQPETTAALTASVTRLLNLLPDLGLNIGEDLQSQLNTAAISAARWLGTLALSFGTSIPDLIARLFIFLGILAVLLPNYQGFVNRLRRLSPLDDEVDNIFLRKVKLTVQSMFIGIFVIAVAQGLVTGLFFWLAGIPYSPLLTLIAVVLSMFPLGASLIALPVGIGALAMGEYTAGLIVIGGYVLVVSNVDTFLRPRLVSRDAYLNFALVLLSALGGYDLFGFFGVVYGPVLMILFLTALDVYETYYAEPSSGGVAAPSAVAERPVLPVARPAAPRKIVLGRRRRGDRATKLPHRDRG